LVGEEVQLLLILDFGIRWGWVVSEHAPTTLYPWYPLDRRLCGPQSRSEHRGYKKKSFASAGDLTPIAQLSSP
jgi:hypothetical protein